jgi:plasmid replication initiation protein
MISYLERIAMALISDADIPPPIREYHLEDRWVCDFIWITDKALVMLSIDYGKNKDGKFIDSIKYQQDIEKQNEASIRGYTVIRASKAHMISGQMVEWLKKALNIPPQKDLKTLADLIRGKKSSPT